MGFGAVQTLVGVTKLSELGIDVSKNWLTYLINNLGDPVAAQDAATKKYVDDLHALQLLLTGGTMSGNIAMGTKLVTGLGAPVADNDAARKKYVDDIILDRSKVIWKDISEYPFSFSSQSDDIPWTELDLTAYTSANAKFAILLLELGGGATSGSFTAYLGVRKNGATQSMPIYVSWKATQGVFTDAWKYSLVIVGMDSSQRIEYEVSMDGIGISNGDITVLGYIE